MVKLSLDGSVASRSSGFRLQELQDGDRDSVTSASVYSGYKLRIDSMFEGPRSQIGGYEAKLKEQQVIANTVQARIEKMFAEVSKVDEKKHGCCFPIKYLGAVVLSDKVTSLRGLQEPLKELYLDQRPRHAGHIEISDEGLRVNDELKPFQTIAVWSAIQFVLRKTPEGVVEYAFLPLIADPDAVDKGSLFRRLMTTRGTILEAATGLENHPLFAVVMRQRGSSKVLECHGFVCAGAEDAIVIAANLYQALMSSMQRGGSAQRRSAGAQPRSKHGVSYVSLAGSSQAGSQVGTRSRPGDDDIEVVSSERLRDSPEVSTRPNGEATPTPPPASTSASASRKSAPVRPPRQKKKSVTSSDSDDLLVEDPEEMRVPPMADVRVRRVASDSCVASMEVADRGDILTKIAIPRSHSFLTPGGALMRYQRPSEPHGHGSPLGFHELFTEFRLQEGLHSLDDILDVIIDADGMSFNDLKPIYKEFLMKLAVTLTKDELYQRSKNIMRRQRKKLERRDKRKTNVKKVFKRTVISKMRPTSPKSNFEFTSVLFPSGNTRKKKPVYAVASGNTSRRRHARSAPRRASRSAEDDADLAGGDNKRASSGYVSCSECSFDSELCSCRNKCYCTKPSGVPMACRCKGGQCSCKALALPALPCACDTDSCRESDKCYCKNSKNAFEQLRRRGFAASESSNSRPASPEPHKSKKKHSSVKSTKSLEFLQMKPKWDTPPGSVYQKRMDVYESLPAIRQHQSVPDQRRSCSFDNLGRYRERKVLVVSARDTRGNVIYNKTSETAPHDALSVKKSAEIAALFHEVKFRRDRDPLYHTLEPPPEYFTMRHRKQGNDMETSLGYLP